MVVGSAELIIIKIIISRQVMLCWEREEQKRACFGKTNLCEETSLRGAIG